MGTTRATVLAMTTGLLVARQRSSSARSLLQRVKQRGHGGCSGVSKTGSQRNGQERQLVRAGQPLTSS